MKMTYHRQNPRVLIVTPEVTYLPNGMGNLANNLAAKAGGLADVSAALISTLFDEGADVHVALPDYRAIFRDNLDPVLRKEIKTIRESMPDERIHLAEDRAFFYKRQVYSSYSDKNIKVALAFQREVINNIIPRVKPDLIHCNDWMTGLIPAVTRQMGIPSLFTIHNIHTVMALLSYVEDVGIDAASFWSYLFFERIPFNYEYARGNVPVDFLTSGVFAAHFVNTVSHTFLQEVIRGQHVFVQEPLRRELANKWNAGCAVGILNAPDPSFNPSTDKDLSYQYGPENCVEGKMKNKKSLQERLGLIRDDKAPLLFWPSRLDQLQKGCQLLAEILYAVLSRYWNRNLEIVFVANGDFQVYFKEIVQFHNLHDRVAICDFDESLSRLAYGASDFVLMPSLFEPCGLPQMIGPIYGSLPIANDTGGIHDTVVHMDADKDRGNGFLFNVYDPNGFFWAINEAMLFYELPREVRERHIKRIMTESVDVFSHAVTAKHYIDLYEKMLQRPLIKDEETS